MKLVLDTDVLVAGLRSPSGASRQLLLAVADGRLTPVASTALLYEYEAVPKRAEHRKLTLMDDSGIDRFLDAFAARALLVSIEMSYRPLARDPDDDMVIEAAIHGNANGIVSFNQKDYRGIPAFYHIEALTPAECIRRLDHARL